MLLKLKVTMRLVQQTIIECVHLPAIAKTKISRLTGALISIQLCSIKTECIGESLRKDLQDRIIF